LTLLIAVHFHRNLHDTLAFMIRHRSFFVPSEAECPESLCHRILPIVLGSSESDPRQTRPTLRVTRGGSGRDVSASTRRDRTDRRVDAVVSRLASSAATRRQRSLHGATS
jgi:hypothetical protein